MTLLKCAIGIDISKDKFDVCLSIIDDRQAVNVKAQSSFLNNKNGFVKFWTWTIKNAKNSTPL